MDFVSLLWCYSVQKCVNNASFYDERWRRFLFEPPCMSAKSTTEIHSLCRQKMRSSGYECYDVQLWSRSYSTSNLAKICLVAIRQDIQIHNSPKLWMEKSISTAEKSLVKEIGHNLPSSMFGKNGKRLGLTSYVYVCMLCSFNCMSRELHKPKKRPCHSNYCYWQIFIF